MREMIDQFPIRLPNGVRARMKELAKRNRRSANSEYVLAVEAWLDREASASKAVTGDSLAADPVTVARNASVDQNARQASSFRARKESAGTAGALGSLRFG